MSSSGGAHAIPKSTYVIERITSNFRNIAKLPFPIIQHFQQIILVLDWAKKLAYNRSNSDSGGTSEEEELALSLADSI